NPGPYGSTMVGGGYALTVATQQLSGIRYNAADLSISATAKWNTLTYTLLGQIGVVEAGGEVKAPVQLRHIVDLSLPAGFIVNVSAGAEGYTVGGPIFIEAEANIGWKIPETPCDVLVGGAVQKTLSDLKGKPIFSNVGQVRCIL